MSIEKCHSLTLYSWAKDKKLRFTSCNENTAMAASADSPKAMLGKTDYDMIWKDFAEAYQVGEDYALRGKYYSSIEIIKTQSGIKKILVSKSPLYNNAEEIVGTIGSSLEIDNDEQIQTARFSDGGELILCDNFNNVVLTKREAEVMRYIVKGFTAKKIALCLGISFRTVEHYIASIRLKLQCSSIGEMIATSISAGLNFVIESYFSSGDKKY